MLGQSKISSFFTSQPVKRRIEDNKTSPPAKALKTENSSLSPEQKQAIEEKRMAALAKLANKVGPNNMGLSWKKALAVEFNKDYFKKVKIYILTNIFHNVRYLTISHRSFVTELLTYYIYKYPDSSLSNFHDYSLFS